MSEPGVPPPPSYVPPPPPPIGPGGSTVSPNRTLMIALSYIWILFIVPFVAEKEDREVQWHARHGLVITIAEIIFWVAFMIVQRVLGHIIGIGCITGCLGPFVFSAAFLALRVLCIIKGINGQRFIIPGVSQYADRF
jgi:uncharacterized membrane protein